MPTGVPRIRTPPPQDPTARLCLGPYGGPKGAASYERGTPVQALLADKDTSLKLMDVCITQL